MPDNWFSKEKSLICAIYPLPWYKTPSKAASKSPGKCPLTWNWRAVHHLSWASEAGSNTHWVQRKSCKLPLRPGPSPIAWWAWYSCLEEWLEKLNRSHRFPFPRPWIFNRVQTKNSLAEILNSSYSPNLPPIPRPGSSLPDLWNTDLSSFPMDMWAFLNPSSNCPFNLSTGNLWFIQRVMQQFCYLLVCDNVYLNSCSTVLFPQTHSESSKERNCVGIKYNVFMKVRGGTLSFPPFPSVLTNHI